MAKTEKDKDLLSTDIMARTELGVAFNVMIEIP